MVRRHYLVSPETTITQGPPAHTAARTATFRWAGVARGDIPSRFRCRVDGGRWALDCPMPFTTGELADGEHTLEVRQDVWEGLDTALELEPARWTWRVDGTAPRTTVTDAQLAFTTERSATIAFAVDEADSRSECRLDEGEWAGEAAAAPPGPALLRRKGGPRTVTVSLEGRAGPVRLRAAGDRR